MSQIMPLPPRSAGVSDLLEAAALLFRATLFKCLPVALVAMLGVTVPVLYLEAKGFKFAPGHLPEDPQFWWLYGIGFLVNLFLLSAVLVRQRTLIQGQTPDLGNELRFALKKLPLMTLTWVLGIAGVMLGTIALFVPGIFLGVCLSVLQCTVLFESHAPAQAIVRSVKLVQPFWWRCCAVIVIGTLVSFLCILAASAVLALIFNVTGTATSNEGRAIQTAIGLGFDATAMVFFTSMSLVLYSAAGNHSAASNSA